MAHEPLAEFAGEPPADQPAAPASPPESADGGPSEPGRSRRSILGAGLAGLAGLFLGSLARPAPTQAAAGGSLIMGASNSAGTANTTLATNSTGTALYVAQNGSGTALRGIANDGIAGFFTSSNGSGVSGVVANDSKYGVYGGNDATEFGGGAGIRANGEKNHGLIATSASAEAFAIKATNTNPATGSAAGTGIRVLSSAGTDSHITGQGQLPAAGEFCGAGGVIGVAVGNGTGVYATSDSGTGLWAVSTSGEGVKSISSSNYGVNGFSVESDGVHCSSLYGDALYADGRAYVNGDLGVAGNLSKAGGSFKIDHPLDPANKFLYHSFVESPDMLDVYGGTVTLDARGEATVTLPDWFEALNRDCRYQLTPIGRAAPDLHVKSKIRDGRFSIGGGTPEQEVCWQITGIRQDAWANAHRIPLDEDKPAAERGLYLHPAEHGQPKTKGIDAVRNAGRRPTAK